jgi:hypothetical protein
MIAEIVEGWYNLLTKKHPAIQFMVKRRYESCKDCPFRKGIAGVTDMCGKCGCHLKAKLHSYQSSCPINKWSKVDCIIEGDSVQLKENNIIIYNNAEF